MPKVLIAGAGLVGALNAVFFARRGWDVEVYEFRSDIREIEHVPGRSINLALSQRGKSALEAVGLRSYIVDKGVEMHARLVHDSDGLSVHRQPYGQPGEHIISINRRHLNEVMITEAERFQNVNFFFEYKVQKVDLKRKMLVLNNPNGNELVEATGDLILACDGAFSAIRRSLMAQPRFDFAQEYIEHGYVELNILPRGNEFAMEPNVFHLWPRGDFTLIALANTDRTFTLTLFAPFEVFERQLGSAEQQVAFFRRHFPDVLELMGEKHVVEVFERVKRPSALISLKCKPHGFADVLLLMGDAAHSMLPFYGQGMNAGFEDCLILDEVLSRIGDNIPLVVNTYSSERWPDAHVIIDLALYNYKELKDLVNKWTYKLRKKLDLGLNRLLPNTWIPLYSMVTFTRIPYREVAERRRRQDTILQRIGLTVCFALAAVGLYAGVRIHGLLCRLPGKLQIERPSDLF